MRENIWECSWPHEILTPESEARLAAAVERYRPWIEAQARSMAHGDRFLRRELEQIARLVLWEYGWQKIERTSPRELANDMTGRMKNARRAERRAQGGINRQRVRGFNN